MKMSLKNLSKFSAQEVFDFVVAHLRKQNAKSVWGTTCVYRSDDGLMCAAGCLMADEEYRACFERRSWRDLVMDDRVPDAHRELICALQRVHDNVLPVAWEGHLFDVSLTYKLVFPPNQERAG